MKTKKTELFPMPMPLCAHTLSQAAEWLELEAIRFRELARSHALLSVTKLAGTAWHDLELAKAHNARQDVLHALLSVTKLADTAWHDLELAKAHNARQDVLKEMAAMLRRKAGAA